ncbi:hypothetical protein ACLBW2_00110, partial [Enterobacteriaceae bacterium C23F]
GPGRGRKESALFGREIFKNLTLQFPRPPGEGEKKVLSLGEKEKKAPLFGRDIQRLLITVPSP